MQIALIVLNLIFLVCSLWLNAELLNLGGSDVTLNDFNAVAEVGQFISSFGLTLICWKLLTKKFQGKPLYIAWATSFLISYPIAYVAQDMVAEYVSSQISHPYKAAALYAYIVKKDFTSKTQGPDSNTGAYRAYMANLGIVLGPHSKIINMLDGKFPSYAASTFKDYIELRIDDFYGKFQDGCYHRVRKVVAAYWDMEKIRGVSSRFAPDNLQEHPDFAKDDHKYEIYAKSLPFNMKREIEIFTHPRMHWMCQHFLGPLYVNGMKLHATKEEFKQYAPHVAKTMALQVASTDMNSEQGQLVIRNMLFLPIALFTSLFFSTISFMMLMFGLIELLQARLAIQIKAKLKIGTIVIMLVSPLLIGNELVDSERYHKVINGAGPVVTDFDLLLRWSIVTEGWLYDLRNTVKSRL